MTNSIDKQTVEQTKWAALLEDAVRKPGKMLEAYRAFHNYSFGNVLLAMFQCEARGIAMGPLASFDNWKSKKRYVRKGEKAIILCRPVVIRLTEKDEPAPSRCDYADYRSTQSFAMLDEEKSASKGKVIKRFVYEAKWFVMNQTDGADYKLPEMPSWNKETALAGLGINEIPFSAPVSGNCQGFARKDQVAINPLAQLPHKTLFHEMAHVVLGHTKADNYQAHGAELPLSLMEVEAESTAMLLLDALELPGAEYCRGYIQNWLGEGKEIPESSAKRIIAVAEKILRAGQQKAQQRAAA